MRRILELNHTEAKQYFLKEESYFNFDLPKYFVFQTVLSNVSAELNGKSLTDYYSTPPTLKSGKLNHPLPSDFDDVNYKLLNNKDGKFAWRPLQLIHPALYVSLVHKICEPDNWQAIKERFKEFNANPKIQCFSIPINAENGLADKPTSIKEWWLSIEQQSIELALEFEYVLHTDITDCYGSIYTHSVPWALHGKEVAKLNRKNDLLGNAIDEHLRNMSHGQTNGIPQGSATMDFIAEMILGYADLKLSEKIIGTKITDFKIIRYRDDYRIFTNNPQEADTITKLLTEILIGLGMRLNAQKTINSNNVVRSSIKPDKLYWITARKSSASLREHLLLIHSLSEKYPNSGSLSKALGQFHKKIKKINELKQNIQVLVSILVDIMYKNPKTYPITSAILSKFLSLLDNPVSRDAILLSISKRFDKIPNTGHIEIWMQRLTLKLDRQKEYEESLCKKVNDNSIKVWNSTWLNQALQDVISTSPII